MGLKINNLFYSFMAEVGTSHPTVEGTVLLGADMPRFVDIWFNNVLLRFGQNLSVKVIIKF